MPQTKPFVDIIVTSYQNKEIIDRCLSSIRNQNYRNYRCVLVDDYSTDGTPEYVMDKYPWVTVIKKNKNTGPSASRNIGINETNNKYVATLDSDVFLKPDWLKEMIKFMEMDERIAISASKILFSSDEKRINSAGGTMRKIGIGVDIGFMEVDSKRYDYVRELLYACSAAMMIRRKVLEKIGFFDERYFYGYEDLDLCWRANLAGYKVIYNPKAVVFHDSNSTIRNLGEKIKFHETKNIAMSMMKNYELKNIIMYLPAFFILNMLGGVRRKQVKTRLRAWYWIIKNFPSIYRSRFSVQKIRRIKDDSIFRLVR